MRGANLTQDLFLPIPFNNSTIYDLDIGLRAAGL